jgi:tRNA pseudouridine55 synthase
MRLDEKEYLATIRLGVATDTYDGDGRIMAEKPIPELTLDRVNQVLENFRGEVCQLPPMFSAVKVEGERLYKAARRGEIRSRPPRTVTFFRLDLVDQRREAWDLRIHCSSGTYVRSLANDIGEHLGCGAHLEKLRRIRSGIYDLSTAVQLEKVEENWSEFLVKIDQLLPELPAFLVDSGQVEAILHGNPIVCEETSAKGENFRLMYEQKLLAVGERVGPRIHPKVVLVRNQAK